MVKNKGTIILENMLNKLNNMSDDEVWEEYKRLEKKVEGRENVKIIVDFTANKNLYDIMSNKNSLKNSVVDKVSKINANNKLYEELRLVI